MRTNPDQDRSLFRSPAAKSGRLTGTRLWERQPGQEPARARPAVPWAVPPRPCPACCSSTRRFRSIFTLLLLHTSCGDLPLYCSRRNKIRMRNMQTFRISRRRVLENSARQSLNPNLKILSTLFGFVNI